MERELRKEFSTRHLFIWTIIIVLTFILSILIYLDTNSFGDEILLSPGDIVISICQDINAPGYYVLDRNLTTNDNCIDIKSDEVTLDGNGYEIKSMLNSIGVSSSNYRNISIFNLKVHNFLDSLSFTNISYLVIENVTLIEDTNSRNYKIKLINDSFVYMSDVYFENENNSGKVVVQPDSTTSSTYLFENVSFAAPLGNGTLWEVNPGGNNLVVFNTYVDRHSFLSVSGSSPDIKFTNSDISLYYPDLTSNGNMLSSNLNISYNFVYINESSVLNRSAEITMSGLPTNMNEPVILKKGVVCTDCYNLTSLNAGTVIFNISSGGNYTIIDANPLQVIDVNEPRNKTYRNGDFPLKLDVDLSEAGSVWFKLDNGTNVSMNTTNNLNFNYSLSIPSYGSHYFQAFANDSAGLDYVYSDIIYFSVSNSSGSSGGAGSSGSGGSSGYSITGWTSSTNIDYSLINSSTGYSVDLDQRSRITFNFGSFQEFVGVVNVSGPSALIETSGDPVRQNILVGEAYNFDLNDDGPSDIEVRLETINNNKVSLRIKDISQSAVITSQVIPNSQEVDAGAAEEKIRTSAKIFWGVFALFGSILLVAIVYVVINLIKKKETEANLTLQS